MKKTTSHVNIDLVYEGDPFIFWDILKKMKVEAEQNKVKFSCGNVTTIEEE